MFYPIAFGMPSGAEWLIVAAIGLLLFGKRLPEVGRSLGRGIVEFKKGLRGVEEEFRSATDAVHNHALPSLTPAESIEPTVPKFESPHASPVPTMEYEPQPYQD